MIFEIEIGGRTRRVSVEPVGAAGERGGRFQIAVDDRTCLVDARRTELGWSVLYEDDRRSLDVAVTDERRGDVLVQLPNLDLRVAIDGRQFHGGPLDGGRSASEGVTAPMPGRVVRILVKAGDEVIARQGLVIVEAMKMENELSAPRAGRVTEVLVTEGESVEAGRLLVRLE